MELSSYETMGKRLFQARKKKNLTQEKLAEFLEVSEAHVGRLERGETPITLPTLIKACEILEIQTEWILYGIRSPENPDNQQLFERISNQCNPEILSIMLKTCEQISKVNPRL